MMVFEHNYKDYPELTNKQLADFGFSSPHEQIENDFRAEVVKVHDGDTVTLRTEFRDFDFPLRLLDIDAPELNEGGQEVQAWLENRLLGEEVWIIIDRNQRVGKYGRLLGKIMHGGFNVGEEMMLRGMVFPFGKKNEGQPEDLNKIFRTRQWFTT